MKSKFLVVLSTVMVVALAINTSCSKNNSPSGSQNPTPTPTNTLVPSTITTFAGNGTPGHLGDSGAATIAELNYPTDLTLDNSGNLFIADTSNHCIRKVATNGIITKVAGLGVTGYSGDGGPATLAVLYYPYGVAVDTSGNLFIADCWNHRIRKVNTSGIITTVAGCGVTGFAGDGGLATAAKLYYPDGVAVDISGNLFIVDGSNARIRKVDTSGIITTVAGNGIHSYSGDSGAATLAALDTPTKVTIDTSGNLFIADSANERIRKVDTSGVITTVAGNGTSGFAGDGGSATSASFNAPEEAAVDAAGNLYIADT